MDTPNNNQPTNPQTTGNSSVPPPTETLISHEEDTKNVRRQTAAEDELAQALAEERGIPQTTAQTKPSHPPTSSSANVRPQTSQSTPSSDSKFFAVPQKQSNNVDSITKPGTIPQKTNAPLSPKMGMQILLNKSAQEPQPPHQQESIKPVPPTQPKNSNEEKQEQANPQAVIQNNLQKKTPQTVTEKIFTPHPKLKTLRTFHSDMAGLVRDNGESIASIAVAAQKKQAEKEKVVPTPITVPTKKETPEPIQTPPEPKPIPKPDPLPNKPIFQKPFAHPAQPTVSDPQPMPKKAPPQAPISRHATMPAITRTNPAKNEAISVKSASSIPFFRNTILVLVSVALVGFGGFTLYSTFFVQQTVNKPVTLTQPQTIVAYDTYTTIPFDVRETLIQNIQGTKNQLPASTGSIAYAHLEVSPEDLLTRLTPQIPQVLSRILQHPYAMGYYQDGAQQILFLAVTVESYGQALSGMLSWEPVLYREMSELHGDAPIEVRTGFIDTVIENKDARKLTNASGETLMVYGFIDNNTLIITENEAVFRGVANNILIKRSTR